MPVFTAYIDRDGDPRVKVIAPDAAYARQYASSRYGKVLKLKTAPESIWSEPSSADLSRLRNLRDGIGTYRDKLQRLRALGLIDARHELTDAGHSALAALEGEGSDEA